MKALVIIVGVFAVMTIVYGLDTERLQKFKDNFVKCSEKLGVSPSDSTGEALRCALDKDGKIFNANGEYMKDAVMEGLADVISDANTLDKARNMFTTCYNDGVQNGGTGAEQTLKIATCSLPIMALLDKL